MIQIEVIGRIGNGGEMKTIGDKQAFCFSVAHDEKVNGQKVTTWIDVVYYANQSKVIQWLQKGAMVRVCGRAGFRAYTNKSGLNVVGVTVYPRDVDVLLFAKDESQQQGFQQVQQPVYPKPLHQPNVAGMQPSSLPFVNPAAPTVQQNVQQAAEQFFQSLSQPSQQ
ncbi:MAG: single-stranded DNA-binding protein [Bacteroidales bacterium]|nr:single-stranded DNA-binding protein [Bacteroidales bacterium]